MAVTPLWQLLHGAVSPRWLKLTAVHAIVPWQALQSSLVWMCWVGLPEASTPLWQLAQLAVTPW